ncbi:hypothetical protein [Photobacterium atrarenae]|uniref:C2H2-type domain-containing protein n=1 Tax=Photobacterium atrarenae TaxID=865757 RepID=A0ABY5GNC7_9GAMM|nr:hypothetical protein [Photobacterium atrarenae]UTV30844.1 hypothetical protein NNL38_20015 [Photobacterium atrarenae]
MSEKKPNQPRESITFKCVHCNFTFKAAPERVEDEPKRAHPFRYFGKCTNCQREVQQVPWEVGQFCSVLASTGPKTAEGKARSAANLAGHPTAAERAITRFNALKHGANAKTALFFPARPGKYPQCATCDVDHAYCATQPACIKRTELMMQHLIAFQSGDPTKLTELHAINQANLAAIFQDMMQTIVADGVSLRNPVYDFDKEGGFHIGQYKDGHGDMQTIEEVKAHPLLKPMLDMLSKNNLSMADLNMTPKVQVDQGIEMGKTLEQEDERESALEYQQKMNEQMAGLRQLISRSQQRVRNDSILIEHNHENGAEEAEVIEVDGHEVSKDG